MGGVLVQGAALGAAFELLFISAIDATQRVACFSSDFNRLESTLCSIKLVIDDVENFNRILDRPHQETQIFTDRLLKGEKLIRRCSNVKRNVFKRLYYSRKLSNLESVLVNFFQINVAALHFRESKRISVVVEQQMKEITSLRVDFKEKFNELTSIVKKNQICGYCNSKNDVCIPMIVDGFEHSSQGKKEGMQLENSGENTNGFETHNYLLALQNQRGENELGLRKRMKNNGFIHFQRIMLHAPDKQNVWRNS